ncbi:MAG: redoxin domain-containing protein [Bryobacteraceae bacterium]|nr:redoxin domain-containing protein [Bryobacterales bacterium]MEB2362647.1 redoxin domain-containing protein [Bryobacterales bacterium]NUN01091.1 redoxin domain-containing protein [Bryobacteraceae bacterium]
MRAVALLLAGVPFTGFAQSPATLYAEARALADTNTAEAIQRLEDIVQRWPKFAEAHLSLGRIYLAPGFRNREEAIEHLRRAMDLRPDSLEPYRLLAALPPSNFLSRSARRMRELLQKSTDPDDLAAFPVLWSIEFRSTPPSRHSTVRDRVKEDVARLNAKGPRPPPAVLYALSEARRILGTAETPGTGWRQTLKPLPPFRLPDLSGRVWTPDDFKGKVALINVWATWCGPCRVELPHIQRLHEKVKNRTDLLVLTLNVDGHPGRVDSYLKEGGYTFPVIPAGDYALEAAPVFVVPQTWIVDGSGMIREQSVGFAKADENWVDEILRRMEQWK